MTVELCILHCEKDFLGQTTENTTKSNQAGSTSQSQSEQADEAPHKVPSNHGTFRLVGESYIHLSSSEIRIKNDEENHWFRLW